MLERFAYHLATAALSILDGPFWVYNKLLHRAPIRFPDSDTWTDEEIIRAIESAPYLESSDDKLVQISEDTVVKLCRDWDSTTSEALAMDLVRKQTRIAIPRMRRVIRHLHPEGNGLIVMDLVRDSQQLRVTWPSLSLWGKLKVILTIRLYLWQLRRVQHASSSRIPGPLGPAPLPCNGLQFGFDEKGPFPTISALETHFRKEHAAAEVRASRGWAPSPDCKPLDPSAFTSLMFTHNDLNMRNLLLDKDGVLWVVDWGWAGFYPPWFEFLGMRYATQKDKDPESWQECIKYMAEPAVEVEGWMKRIGYDYTDLT
ncbi:hypothetical protein EDD18DRAFT_1295467 [Armillaria luteobubalina]|uniref:Aminoglycoside phosphotransferase domain-containing protein n=1 Tax=Armillaria luteobubalina TaxID=153913 RepID=A0AA39P950_9AGAR|nr:hypothetical protein EDD18DRAFT_1295467 [Armillaria luteobubalina]